MSETVHGSIGYFESCVPIAVLRRAARYRPSLNFPSLGG